MKPLAHSGGEVAMTTTQLRFFLHPLSDEQSTWQRSFRLTSLLGFKSRDAVEALSFHADSRSR